MFLPFWTLSSSATGSHPSLRLARRPNRGHIGGGGWTPSCGTCRWFLLIASGFSTTTLVNNEIEALILYFTKEIRRDRFQFYPETNVRKKFHSPGPEPMTWNLEGLRGYQLDHRGDRHNQHGCCCVCFRAFLRASRGQCGSPSPDEIHHTPFCVADELSLIHI